jgi:hypothetical protein
MSKTGKTDQATRVGQLLAGTKKRFTNGSQVLSLAGGSKSVTIDDVENAMNAFLTNRAAVTAAQATAKAEVAAENEQTPALLALIRAFEAFVRFTLGGSPEALADFGLAPTKARTPLTAEQKAVAAAKRDATRVARGTKSAKQKKAIKGNVTATLVVTPVGPDTAKPPVPPVPAPAAAPSGTAPAQLKS